MMLFLLLFLIVASAPLHPIRRGKTGGKGIEAMNHIYDQIDELTQSACNSDHWADMEEDPTTRAIHLVF